MHLAGLEPAIPASELPPTYNLDHAAARMAIIQPLNTTQSAHDLYIICSVNCPDDGLKETETFCQIFKYHIL
jgi:hypothetical protein